MTRIIWGTPILENLHIQHIFHIYQGTIHFTSTALVNQLITYFSPAKFPYVPSIEWFPNLRCLKSNPLLSPIWKKSNMNIVGSLRTFLGSLQQFLLHILGNPNKKTSDCAIGPAVCSEIPPCLPPPHDPLKVGL